MSQKGFATIFGLCFILIIALCVKGIQESETNHAHEVSNFEMEQILQSAAESGIIRATNLISGLPYSEGRYSDKKNLLNVTETRKCGGKIFNVTINVRGERGKIYFYDRDKTTQVKNSCDGVYLMSRATIKNGFLGEKVYRRAYAYILDNDATIYFMELPTLDGDIIVKKKS